jgi:hypothetical protein
METCARHIADGVCPVNLAIEKELSVLGESVKEAWFYYLNERGVPRQDIPFQPKKVRDTLAEILGIGGDVLTSIAAGGVREIRDIMPSDTSCSHRAAARLEELQTTQRGNESLG